MFIVYYNMLYVVELLMSLNNFVPMIVFQFLMIAVWCENQIITLNRIQHVTHGHGTR